MTTGMRLLVLCGVALVPMTGRAQAETDGPRHLSVRPYELAAPRPVARPPRATAPVVPRKDPIATRQSSALLPTHPRVNPSLGGVAVPARSRHAAGGTATVDGSTRIRAP
jgi:hypothetical protein